MASLTDFTVPTETGVAVFAILSGVGGAAAQILASQNLGRYPNDRIAVKYVLPAVAASVLASAAAAYFLIPDGQGQKLRLPKGR